ncbi:MAG: T9SS type A sorting domain-containing protein [Brumimicrobium sp.]
MHYPNPTDKKAILQISSFEESNYNVSFFNNVGRTVDIKLVPTSTGYEVNTSGIASGVYQVVLRHKNGVVSNKKLVTQH